jgi:hypothetical protein
MDGAAGAYEDVAAKMHGSLILIWGWFCVAAGGGRLLGGG